MQFQSGKGPATMEYRHIGSFGGKGTAAHQFASSLNGITIGPEGLIYVVGDSEVKVFNAAGTLHRRWQTEKPALSVDVSHQQVFVGEEGQVEIFDLAGKRLTAWTDSANLGAVTAIETVGSDVIVADAVDRCIRRFDQSGKLLNNIGHDNRMKGFNIPNGALDFSIDDEAVIFACNPGKHRVERYTLGGELLGHIGRFDGRDPKGFQGCCNPTNVAVAKDGLVYVTEKAGPRAKVLDRSGDLIGVIATDVFDPNCKNMDLVVDSVGRIYVTDTVRLTVHVFVAADSGLSQLAVTGTEGIQR